MKFRLLLTAVFATGVVLTQCGAQAPYHQHAPGTSHAHQSATQYRRALPIVHYGYGYVHDPYARGSFEMQDPLNDPLFQAQHKFDSQFPGRYSADQKRQYQQRVWKLFQR